MPRIIQLVMHSMHTEAANLCVVGGALSAYMLKQGRKPEIENEVSNGTVPTYIQQKSLDHTRLSFMRLQRVSTGVRGLRRAGQSVFDYDQSHTESKNNDLSSCNHKDLAVSLAKTARRLCTIGICTLRYTGLYIPHGRKPNLTRKEVSDDTDFNHIKHCFDASRIKHCIQNCRNNFKHFCIHSQFAISRRSNSGAQQPVRYRTWFALRHQTRSNHQLRVSRQDDVLAIQLNNLRDAACVFLVASRRKACVL